MLIIWQRHLLPFQMGQGDYEEDGAAPPGRPRPHYTYSRKSTFKKNKGAASGLDLTDNDDNSNSKEVGSCNVLLTRWNVQEYLAFAPCVGARFVDKLEHGSGWTPH